jgi:purine nucleosidase
LVLDTDIGGDVDDALALALALRHPDIDLRAVTTVSGDTTLRAHLAARLIAIAGGDLIEVAAGLTAADNRNWNGHEGDGLAPGQEAPLSARDAVDVLAGVGAGTVIATIGMQSNVAAAVARRPEMVGTVGLLAVMGGAFAPLIALDGTELDAWRDWNLFCDPTGAVQALNAGFPTLYVPCDVTFHAPLRQAHLDRLRTGDELCRTLATLVDAWREQHLARPGALAGDDVVALLHDPLTVTCVVDRSFVTTERLPVTVVIEAGVPRTVIDAVRGHDAEVVRTVDAPAFADWFVEVVTGG